MDECPHCGCRLDDIGEWFDGSYSHEADGYCEDCGKPVHVEMDYQYIISKGEPD